MAQQTAVDWYIHNYWFIQNKLKSKIITESEFQIQNKKLIEKAIKIEKKQIQKAFMDGQDMPINHPCSPHYSTEEYYNYKYYTFKTI